MNSQHAQRVQRLLLHCRRALIYTVGEKCLPRVWRRALIRRDNVTLCMQCCAGGGGKVDNGEVVVKFGAKEED